MHVDNSSACVHRYPIQRWMWGVFAFLLVALSAASALLLPLPAQAGIGDWTKEMIALILSSFVFILGKLLLLAIYILTLVAQYNKFIEAAAVINGWVIVRDLANMFFIVILLIIAFATILNISSYQWKAMLPQLLIAAILINFSKTIAGILIDVSQVVTLTFVNGFAAAAGGNFGQMFQIQGMLTLNPPIPGNPTPPLDLFKILGSFFLAMILLIIAIVITLIMAVIFAFRIVMLWALVVLSPLPWLLRVIPAGKKYADKWWTMFGEYLTIGPVLAFFLWLALVSVGTGTVGQDIRSGAVGGSQADADALAGATGAIPTQAATPDALMSFVIAICMLVAGMKIAGEMGVMGAGAMKGAADKMGSIAKGAAKKFTGYRYASERVSGVMAAREQARKEKVGDSVAAWQGRVGLVQQGIGTAMGGAGIAAGHLAFGRRAKAADKQADEYRKKAAAARDAGDVAEAEGHEKNAIAAQNSAATLRKKQRWTERGVNAGVVGVAAGLTGGAGLVLAPGLLGRGIADRGKKQREDAKQYKYKKMSAERDALKNLKPGDILTKAQGGPGVSSAEQMAAIITAVEKQLVPPSELQGMRGRLKGLKPDDKTLSTFDSIAGQKYAGTSLAETEEERKEHRPERQRRLRAGQVSMKDVPDAELTADGGSFAADIALHASPEDQKEIRKSKARKAAYQAGLKAAMGAAGVTPADRQKLGAEHMRSGGSLQESFGGDLGAFEQAIKGKGGGDLLAALKPGDLTPVLVGRLAQSADPAQLSQAVKKVSDEGDEEAAQALRGVIDQIREKLAEATKPVADAQGKVKAREQAMKVQERDGQQSVRSSTKRRDAFQVDLERLEVRITAERDPARKADLQNEHNLTRVRRDDAQQDIVRAREAADQAVKEVKKAVKDAQEELEAERKKYASELKKLERLKNKKYDV